MLRELDVQQLHRQTPRTDIQRVIKQMNSRENEYKKEQAIMSQKIEFLQAELLEYKHRDNQNKKLNESIIMSYKNNDHAREENLVNSIRDITRKHQEQLANLKANHNKQTRYLESQLKSCRDRLEHSNIQVDRMKLEHESKLTELKNLLEHKRNETEEEIIRSHKKQLQIVEHKLRKAENTIKTYKQYIEKMNCQNEKNEQFRELSVQYSFLMDDLNKDDRPKKTLPKDRNMTIVNNLNQEDLLMSKVDRTEYVSRQSRRDDTLNQHERRRSMTETISNPNYNLMMASNVEAPLSRRKRSSKLLQSIEQNSRRSRKFLEYNKENINQLTTRITRAISSLQTTSRSYHDTKKIEFLKEKIDRKLKLF